MPNASHPLTSSPPLPNQRPPPPPPPPQFQQSAETRDPTNVNSESETLIAHDDTFVPFENTDDLLDFSEPSNGRWPSWGSATGGLLLEWKPTADGDKPSERFEFSENKLAGVGAGLDNLGNTCFMNAILQCFTHTALLVQGLYPSGGGSSSYSCGIEGFCVLCVLREHVDLALGSPGKSMSPYTFAENVKYISSNFERGQQEDAHEFLQCLLDRLEECCLGSRSKKKCSSQGENIVERIFGGSLKSRLTCCNCGHSSDTPERLVDLSLEIDNVDSLVSALDSFTKVERIEDTDQMFTCESCKEKVSVEKQLLLEKPPSVAAVHLKRFKADGYRVEKISKHVDFPLELDLQPYCTNFHDNNANLKYDLYAVVVHDGYSSDLGHYYCYIRSSPDVWYKLDDWKVTRVQESTVLLEDGYILFYTRKGTPWISDLIEVPKSFDSISSNTSPNSVLDNTDSTYIRDSPLNCDGCEDFESRECHQKTSIPFSRHGEHEADHTRPSEEGTSRQDATSVDGYRTSAIIDNSFQTGPSNRCAENSYNEQELFTCNRESNCNIEAKDRSKILHLATPPTSPKENRHVLDHPVTHDMRHNSLKSEERVKRKRPQSKVIDSPEIRSAIRSAKKHMPMSRRSQFLAAMAETQNEHSSKKGKRTASSPCKKGSSPGAKRHNHRNVLQTLTTATFR